MINCVTRNQIQEAFKRAEKIDVRGEVSIPLHKLKAELEKRRITKAIFIKYLQSYASYSYMDYIEYVSDILYSNSGGLSEEREETFKITSGLC